MAPAGRLSASVINLPYAPKFNGNISTLTNDVRATPTVSSGVLSGPWPARANVTLGGGLQAWTLSATAYANTGAVAGVQATLDGSNVAQANLAFNLTGTHATLPTMMFGTALAAGSHTLMVNPLNSNSSSSVYDTAVYQVCEYYNNPTIVCGSVNGPWSAGSGAANVILTGGVQTWQISASAYANNAAVTGIQVLIDGTLVGTSKLAFNQTGVHASLPTVLMNTSLAAGAHTISIRHLDSNVSSSAFDVASYQVVAFRPS